MVIAVIRLATDPRLLIVSYAALIQRDTRIDVRRKMGQRDTHRRTGVHRQVGMRVSKMW